MILSGAGFLGIANENVIIDYFALKDSAIIGNNSSDFILFTNLFRFPKKLSIIPLIFYIKMNIIIVLEYVYIIVACHNWICYC